MKLYYIWILICVSILVVLLFGINSKNNEHDILVEQYNDCIKKLQDLTDQKSLDRFTELDLDLAKAEWNSWVQISKNQSNFWKSFLDETNNAFYEKSNKTSSSVNTDLTRLLSQLLRECEKSNIKFNSSSQSPSPFLDTESQTSKFGFGFACYDGFWPSFNKEEANLISVQSKIIKQLVEYFLNSFDASDSPTLYSLKRESVGPTDAQFIKEDRIPMIKDAPSLRDAGFVKSYIFQITFDGKTHNLRSFVNQIRPPFSVRSLSVKRFGTTNNGYTEDFFGSKEQSLDTSILPIIREIKSIFTINIEYILETQTDLNVHLQSVSKVNLENYLNAEFLSDI